MAGTAPALCYRLAVATGLRYAEIGSIHPGSLNWDAPSVTVLAASTKNGEEAMLPLPGELADDLAVFLARPPGEPIFPLPEEKGAKLLRADLKTAGIPYQDASGLFLDFHSLRCEMATLTDAAGVTPRVVQKMMRHSSLELTGRYTRLRAVDIETAASMLPSLKTRRDRTEVIVATGTDGTPHQQMLAPSLRHSGDTSGRSLSHADAMEVSGSQASMDGSALESRDLTHPVGSRRRPDSNRGWRFCRPQPPIRKAPLDWSLRQETKVVSHPIPTDTCQTDPDLTAVIAAWDRLPEAIRAGIMAMVKAASG